MYIFALFCFVSSLFIVIRSWYKRDDALLKSLLFSVWICIIIWLNAPNFLSIIDGSTLKKSVFTLPFELFYNYGIAYTIISDALLTSAGILFGKQWAADSKYSKSQTKKEFDTFIQNATEIKIIGRDLDFLLNNNYSSQLSKIKKLKQKAKLLCEQTNDEELIKLYRDLIENGNQVRCYSSRDGIANIKGQIKTDNSKSTYGIFVTDCIRNRRGIPTYEMTKMSSGYLVDSVSQQFDYTFDNSLTPVIKCIALDLGGVYLDGDLDDFYSFLHEKYGIKIKRQRLDKVNINNDLMLGKITIKDFISKKISQKAQVLSAEDWDDILRRWQSNWTPNPNMKKLVIDLAGYGYKIIPFSNLDRENGDTYIREQYLPSCCEHQYFSYQKGKSKPNHTAFNDFFGFAKLLGYVYAEYQILLIDDQNENITSAERLGWAAIHYNSKSDINELIEKLKSAAILPASYSL